MDCAGCGRTNREGARFCGGCGRPLAPRCPACAQEAMPGALFCDACGTPLGARPAAAAEARKVVTIVFADLIGSTALHERLDAESTRAFMDRYYRAMRGAVEAERGTVTQLLGDGVKAVFGAPRVAEDDALRAVRAAVGMQRAFRALAQAQSEVVGELGLRVAVNTGEVVADGESEIIGDPVNVAARLQQEAREGDVLVGESTQRLVSQQLTLEPFGTFALKGRAEPVASWRVVSLDRPAGTAATAFVGRDAELRRIASLYEEALAGPRARLAVILGSPGLGKSRLLAEASRGFGDGATVLAARCDATGGATFAPLVRALRALLQVDDGARSEDLRAALDAQLASDDAEAGRIAGGIAALLAGTPASPEETFFVVRRFLAALASKRPVVLAIDDLHWAEPLLLDLVEHLVQWSSGVPLFLLAAARPELRELRSSLATSGGLVGDVVVLSGLDASAATRLAANVIGADALPAAVAGRVLATSEGNPLFLGELVRMLVDDGALVRQGDRWVAGDVLADLEMPPTIHALLAARIERLRPEERTLLERAAVVGRHFSRAAVAELLPPELRGELDARLEALRRSELIEPDTGWFLGEPVLRFHHVLIRDAAYRRILKGTRAELHARFAEWLEARAGEDAAGQHDETLGWHLEQAHQHLRELGPVDARGGALGERAARFLAAAGRRALSRDDLPLAASLLGRAQDRLDADAPARADLLLDWCEALLATGDVGPAVEAVAELGRLGAGSERLRAWHACFAGQLAVLTDPRALHATADAVAAAAGALAAASDAAGEAKAHSVHALALARLGKIGACEAALDRALAAARRVRDRRLQNAVLAGAPIAALWGPSPVTRASGRCLDVVRVLRITQGAPAVEAVALCCQGVLEALRGRSDAARRMIASARRLLEELGITQRLLEADVFAGQIELLEGDAVAAERWLRAAYDGLRSQGLGIDAAQAAALLGRALLAQGRAAEAEALSHESEALAGDDLKAAIAWRGVRAEALARRGDHAAAALLARAAVEIASATDALLDHADARSALAAVLRAAGRLDDAAAEEARATSLWEAKGASLLAERARSGAPAQPAAPHDAVPEPTRRRVQPNAALANAARMDAAAGARDLDAFFATLAEGAQSVHHPTGAVYAERDARRAYAGLLATEQLDFGHEPVATLGDSLALVRTIISFARSTVMDDFGASDMSGAIALLEVDAQGLRVRTEFFAEDRLGDAIARLYERYAELLPEGPEREHAAATARSVALWLQVAGLEGVAAVVAPAVEFVDHRPAGIGFVRGAEAIRRGSHAQHELARDVRFLIHDVLALCPGAFLLRSMTSGVDRASGGAYERPLLLLGVFGTQGLVTRIEWFDPDREAEALARFDALIGVPAARAAPVRRVRGNAATAFAARLDAAVAAKDTGALEALFAEDMQVVHHPTGTRFGRDGALSRFGALLRAEGLHLFHEPIATLGNSLVLCNAGTSVRALAEDDIAPAGAIQTETRVVIGVDARGRENRVEIFAGDRLGEAIACLYERYAEQQPAGGERDAAARTARSLAALVGPFDLERCSAAIAPDVDGIDHRLTGFGAFRGAAALLRGYATVSEIADEMAVGVDEVLAAAPRALLVRWTSAGRDRTGGGRFEWNFLRLFAIGEDGLLARYEMFDLEREAEALARFDALTAEPPRSARRVRPNAATANALRMDAAVGARDLDAFYATLAEDAEQVNHPTGSVFAEREARRGYAAMLAAEKLVFEHVPLATLGDALALVRGNLSFAGSGRPEEDFGAADMNSIALLEVDARGLRRRTEFFASDRLYDAVARLYARHAELLPEGPERARAAAVARSVETFARPDPVALPFAPDAEYLDHRPLGFPAQRGAEAIRAWIRTLFEAADEIVFRLDEILELRSDGFLARFTNFGTDRAGGGRFERHFLSINVFGADGLLRHWEHFDPDREAEALARFDTLTAEPPCFENAASRAQSDFERCWRERDWEGVAAHFAPGFRMEDRRALVGLDLTGEDFVANLRMLFLSQTSIAMHTELIATRGERLALFRSRLQGELGGGPFEDEHLSLSERDDNGRGVALVLFDLDDLDAAYAELDLRYAAGEAASHRRAALTRSFTQAFAARDWNGLAALLAPDLVVNDHRTLGWETLHGPAAYLQALRSLVELAPDVRLRVDHAEMSDPGYLYFTAWQGTREGGAFEEPSWIVCELDAEGRILRFDQYDLDQQAEARARLAAIGPGAARDLLRIPPNAATRADERSRQAFEARDWDTFATLYSPVFVFEDRRRGVRLSGDREMFIASNRLIRSQETRSDHTLLATSGDRLALQHIRWTGARDAPDFEVELLSLVEVDAEGRIVAVVAFDLDDLRAASAELRERFFRGEGAGITPPGAIEHFRAWHDQDLVRMRATLPDDFWFHDHRRTGAGRIDGADAYIRSVAALFEQLRDVNAMSSYHVALEAHGSLAVARNFGTLVSGGEVEAVFVRLSFYRDGEYAALELFELEDLARARARFEALRTPDLLRIPPNAATRASDRWWDCYEAHDWKALTNLLAPDFGFEDRRRLLRDSGDREKLVASVRVAADAGASATHTLLATAGERLALEQLCFSVGERAASQIEILQITEVGADGRVVAAFSFDLDDRRAASIEMLERYARGEGASLAPAAAFEGLRALNAHDLDRLRAVLPADFYLDDRRRIGLGRLEGAEAFIASLAPVFAQVPDVTFETVYSVASERHGELVVARMFGTLASGGAVEGVYARLGLYRGDRLVGLELFELDDLEQARARFEALRKPDLLRIPPNAATRAMVRWQACIDARDWDGLTALCAQGFAYEDRRPLLADSGNRDKLIESVRLSISAGVRASETVLATAGDRLLLAHVRFSIQEGATEVVVVEALMLTEVDAQDHVLAQVSFETADRPGAFAEMRARFARSEEGRHIPASALDVSRALNERDLERARASMPDDFYYHDHRRSGPGRLDRDAYLAWVGTLFEASPDALITPLYYIDIAPHGSLSIAQTIGTRADGGEFVSAFVQVSHYRDGHQVATELYELDDLEQARARFEALRPVETLRIPPNAATRAMDRFAACAAARDWKALADLLAPDFLFEDRRPLVGDSGDRDKIVASVRLAVSSGASSTHTTLATAGNRLALAHLRFRLVQGATLVSEVDTLQIAEVDAAGRLVAHVAFDPDDRRAAFAELRERFGRSEETRFVPAAVFEIARGRDERDLARIRAALPGDYVFHDHRRTGAGRLEGRDAYVAWVATLFETSPDGTVAPLYYLALEPHGSLSINQIFGRLAEGGGFASVLAQVAHYRDGQLVCTELFELEDLERARARFEALRPARA